MILVADCSALVALAICDSLDLLERLFDSVVVPETVYHEATQPDKKQAHLVVSRLSFLECRVLPLKKKCQMDS